MESLFALMSWIDGLPRWQRPIANGALLVVAWFFMRGGFIVYPIILLLAALRSGSAFILPLIFLPVVAVLGGALGGAVYSMLLPVRRVGAAGRWASWTIAGGIYLVPVLALIGSHTRPPMRFSDPATRFAWFFTSIWLGSLGYWFLGRDENPHSPETRGPSTRGILAEAVAADLDEMRAAVVASPEKAQELENVRSSTPSKALVMHWWRVVGRLGRVPSAVYNLPHRWALDRAEAKLRTAQARWAKVQASMPD